MEVAEAINQDDATRNAKKYPPASRGAGRGRGNFQRGRGKFHGGRGQPRGRPGVSERLCQDSKRINAVTAGVKVSYTLTILNSYLFISSISSNRCRQTRRRR